MLSPVKERYARQVNLPQIGGLGQEKLATATVVIVGCGALGTVSAELLTRAGVGRLRLVDDDCVQWENLFGQILFDEQDARTGQPKVLAACRELNRLNHASVVEPCMTRLNDQNAERLCAGADVVLDGCDNDATRHLINQVCVRRNIPWIFAGVAENYGLVMTIVPGMTPCFACIFSHSKQPVNRTVNQKGLLASATHVVAALQVSEALKLLLGDGSFSRELVYVDAWVPTIEKVQVKSPLAGCAVCGRQSVASQ